MILDNRDALMEAQVEGHKANQAYIAFIGPFIEKRRIMLFEAFRGTSVADKDSLMEVKRMLMAVDALDEDMLVIIENGKIASAELVKYEDVE